MPGTTLGVAATRRPQPGSSNSPADRYGRVAVLEDKLPAPLPGLGESWRRKVDCQRDLGAIVRSIIDTNLYMTFGTADEAGQPWMSPVSVYYAVAGQY